MPLLTHTCTVYQPYNQPQFLAFRLGEVRGDNSQLTEALSTSQSERDAARSGLSDAQQQLAALQQRHAAAAMSAEATLREAAAAAAQERVREREEIKAQAERWVAGLHLAPGCFWHPLLLDNRKRAPARLEDRAAGSWLGGKRARTLAVSK